MIKSMLVSFMIVFGSFSAVADHHEMKEPTKEDRAKMAEMHGKMAECLKSDKPVSECKQEMSASCPMGKDGKGCGMMGKGKKHKHGKAGSCGKCEGCEDCESCSKCKAKDKDKGKAKS